MQAPKHAKETSKLYQQSWIQVIQGLVLSFTCRCLERGSVGINVGLHPMQPDAELHL